MTKISKIKTDDSALNSLIADSLENPMILDSLEDVDNAVNNIQQPPIKDKHLSDTQHSSLESILTSIQKEFEEDVTLNIGNLKEKALMESAIKGKWASKLMAERVKGKILKKNHDELVEGLQKMYASPSAKTSFLNARQTADSMINSSTEVKQIRQEMQDNRQIVDFLEYCWEIVKGLGFTIKNSLEATKIEMGI